MDEVSGLSVGQSMTKQIPRSQAQQGWPSPPACFHVPYNTRKGGRQWEMEERPLSAQTGHLGHLLVTWLSLELPNLPTSLLSQEGLVGGFGATPNFPGLLLSSAAPTTITFTRAHRWQGERASGEPRNRAADRQHLSHLSCERGHMTPIPQGGVEGLKEHR